MQKTCKRCRWADNGLCRVWVVLCCCEPSENHFAVATTTLICSGYVRPERRVLVTQMFPLWTATRWQNTHPPRSQACSPAPQTGDEAAGEEKVAVQDRACNCSHQVWNTLRRPCHSLGLQTTMARRQEALTVGLSLALSGLHTCTMEQGSEKTDKDQGSRRQIKDRDA